MSSFRVRLQAGIGLILAIAAIAATPAAVLGHEERDVAGYTIVIGFIDEPVFTGQKSGMELFVSNGEAPVEGLEQTLESEVVKGEATRALPLSPRFGEAGAYESVFFPTEAGAYTFRIFGTVEGTSIDESFTSSPDGFSEVEEAVSGQFPVTLPNPIEVAGQAERAASAASQATIALALGAAGLLAGLLAVGISLGWRRRA